MYRCCNIISQTCVRFYKGKYLFRASALSFTSLLAFIPLISILVSLLSRFPHVQKMFISLQHMFFENFVPTQGSQIDKYVEEFVHQATKLPLVSFAFLIFISVALLVTVDRTLNHVWGGTSRKVMKSIGVYWLILILPSVVIFAAIAGSTYVFSLKLFSQFGEAGDYHKYLLDTFPLVLTYFSFFILYHVVPHSKVKWGHSLSGAFVATVLFELAKHLFVLYVQFFPTYSLLYGALAVIPLFMIWVYLVWIIVLFGALLTKQLGASELQKPA
jgi:membrane protein